MQSEYKEVVEALENAGWTCCAIESKNDEDPHIEFQKEVNGQTIILIYYSEQCSRSYGNDKKNERIL